VFDLRSSESTSSSNQNWALLASHGVALREAGGAQIEVKRLFMQSLMRKGDFHLERKEKKNL